MKTYQRVNLAEVRDIRKYVTKLIEDGYALIEMCVYDNRITDLTSYGKVKSDGDEDQQVKDFIISLNMTPCYIEEERRVDIEDDAQQLYTLNEFVSQIIAGEEHFSGEEYTDICGCICHDEYYVSIDKGNLGDLGASMECEFVEEWIADNGWKQEEEIDEDF